MTKSAVIYTRVSSSRQVENTSLADQERSCRDYAKRNGYEVIQVFREKGESAKVADRPELIRMLDYVKEPKNKIDTVIIYKVDRLARNHYDCASITRELNKHDVELQSATEPIDETPTGQMMQAILAAFAEFDNSIRAERTKRGMYSVVHDEGRYPHKAPIGYLNERDENDKPVIIPDPEVAPIIQDAFEKFATNTYRYKDIALIFQRAGVEGHRGGKIRAQHIRKFLENEFYIGEIYDYGPDNEHVKLNHKPLVSRELFFKVQEIIKMKTNNADQPRTITHADFPLRQFARCPSCQKHLTGAKSSGRGGKKYAYYRCYNDHCKLNDKSYTAEDLHKDFFKLLQEIEPTQPVVNAFRAQFVDAWEGQEKQSKINVEKLTEKLAGLEEKKQNIIDLGADGALNPQEVKDQLEGLRNKVMVTEIALNDAKTDYVEAQVVLRQAMDLMKNLAKLWRKFGIKGKKGFKPLSFPRELFTRIRAF